MTDTQLLTDMHMVVEKWKLLQSNYYNHHIYENVKWIVFTRIITIWVS